MLDETLVARIHVWDNKVGKAGGYVVGTGYPILPNVLLTAKHVIEREHRDDSKGIHIVWSECSQDDEMLEISDDNDIFLYDGEGRYDLVLLRCATPPLTSKNTAKLSYPFPHYQQSYECRGFPIAGQDHTGHDAISVPGHIIGGYETKQLELNAVANMKKEQDWGGLSGAPIFVDDGLYGVVKIKYETIEKRLYATSIPYLLRNSERFQEAVGVNKQRIAKELTTELHTILIDQIKSILAAGNIPLDKLRKELELDPSATSIDIARYLVKDLSTHDVVEKLSVLSENIEEQFSLQTKQNRWQMYLADVVQLCSWLLLNSIDEDWWLEHGQALLKAKNDNLAISAPLASPNYIEVIISRGLLQPASYILDDEHNAVPASKKHKALLLFDATSDEASDIQILSHIFKDIRRGGTPPQDTSKLLERIKITVKNTHNRRKGKVIYYLVSKEYLTLLQSRTWYKQAEQDMSGYLQFICCDVSDDKEALSPCGDDQSDLLETLAAIMRLRNERD